MTKEVKGLSEIIKGAEVPLEYKKKEMARLTELENELQAMRAKAESQIEKLAQDESEVQKQISKLKASDDISTKSISSDWDRYYDYFVSEVMEPLIRKFISLKEEYENTAEEIMQNYRKIEDEKKQLVAFMKREGIDDAQIQSVDHTSYRFDRETIKKGLVDTQGNQNLNNLTYLSGN